MNLVYGEVTEILDEGGIKVGKVRVGRALRKVPLELLATVRCGDTVLLCESVRSAR